MTTREEKEILKSFSLFHPFLTTSFPDYLLLCLLLILSSSTDFGEVHKPPLPLRKYRAVLIQLAK